MSMGPKALKQASCTSAINVRCCYRTPTSLFSISMPRFAPRSTGMRNPVSSLRGFLGDREDQSQDSELERVFSQLLSPSSLPIVGTHVSRPPDPPPPLVFSTALSCWALIWTWAVRNLFLAPDRSSNCTTTSQNSSLHRTIQPWWARLGKGRAENPGLSLPPQEEGTDHGRSFSPAS